MPYLGRSLKKRYRSHYLYLSWEDPSLCPGQAPDDPTAWEHLSDFDLLLCLVDYTFDRQRHKWACFHFESPFEL